MKEMKENLKLLGAILMLIGVIIVVSFMLFKNITKKSSSDQANVVNINKEPHPHFNLPEFQENDCFLVSKEGESLHPHYIKIMNKNMVDKNYEVLEIIGNGKNKEVNIRLNYYEEMKSFANYRESCPKFEVK